MIYLPDARSFEGLNANFTVSVLFSSDNESSLNDQVEFPKSPVGVKVVDAVILTLSAETEEDGVTNTSMLAVSPFLIVISWGEVWTEKGRPWFDSTLPILFSDHSVNQISSLLDASEREVFPLVVFRYGLPAESCKAFAMPHIFTP